MWPFGFGLSYTTFNVTWSNDTSKVASTSHAVLTPSAESVTYTVTVTNTGGVAGDEVVQAYFKPSDKLAAARAAAVSAIRRALQWFRWGCCAPGSGL
jgi:beta-glucosidase